MKAPDDLTVFAAWWMKHRPILPPTAGLSFPTSTTTGLILYRKPPFQVQLFTFAPNFVIHPHRHAGVDSYEHYLTGQVYFHKNGVELLDRSEFHDTADGVAYPLLRDEGCMIRVGPADWHGALIGPLGGCFLSLQKWLSGSCGLVEEVWEGQPLDDHHAAQIKS